jgi:hypothetical protein
MPHRKSWHPETKETGTVSGAGHTMLVSINHPPEATLNLTRRIGHSWSAAMEATLKIRTSPTKSPKPQNEARITLSPLFSLCSVYFALYNRKGLVIFSLSLCVLSVTSSIGR